MQAHDTPRHDVIGAVRYINDGLRLERDSWVGPFSDNHGHLLRSDRISRLKILAMLSDRQLTRTQSEAILQARNKIQREIISWRQTQFVICPLLKPYIGAVDPNFPEKEKLMLPSSFDQHLHEGLWLTLLAAIEYQLREGQAYDALEDVYEKIKIFNANLDFKKANVFGQWANTCAQQFLSQLAADKISGAEKYRVARRALICLGLSESDASLQELHNDQLYGRTQPDRQGYAIQRKKILGFGWSEGWVALHQRSRLIGVLNVSHQFQLSVQG